MSDMTADWFTPRISARTALAKLLKAKGADWLRGHHLTVADLDVLITQGELAQAADREQQTQLAEAKVVRSGRAVTAAEVGEREDRLAAALPAVILDLREGGRPDVASFLAMLTFARYRSRVTEVASADPTAPDAAAVIKKVARVARTDIATRAAGLAALCQVFASRATLAAALAERGFGAEWLAALSADAEAIANKGPNVLVGVEATAREAAAVRAQRIKWSAVRRLVRHACAGDAPLLAALVAC